jgi:hypothetical protein
VQDRYYYQGTVASIPVKPSIPKYHVNL